MISAFTACALIFTSCGSKEEQAADQAIALMEENCEILESIKDKASAEAAFTKMAALGDKYAELAKSSKDAKGEIDPEKAKEMAEKMAPLTERLTKATTDAMKIISADPDLMKKYQKVSMELGKKMADSAK